MSHNIEQLDHLFPLDVSGQWLRSFTSAFYDFDSDKIARTFVPDGWLRDSLTFTWNNRSLQGRHKISAYLRDDALDVQISNIRMSEEPLHAPTHRSGPSESVEFGFEYETGLAYGKGYVRLIRAGNEWLALTVGMIIHDLKGQEEAFTHDWEVEAGERTWGELNVASEEAASHPAVLIVGGGQNGLQVAARFRQMRIPTLLIERNARIGDNWRQRYDSLALHTPKEHHQLLYQPFPSNWPDFTPRDKLADWLEFYAITQNIVHWTNSTLVDNPVYDKVRKRWSVTVQREGSTVSLEPAHIIMATGVLGAPYAPSFTDRDRFRGRVMHSSEYISARPFTGQRVVVVGAGNSAHDICRDLVRARAASVTMVQRSATCVASIASTTRRSRDVWAPGVHVEVGDLKFASTPLGFIKQQMIQRQAEQWTAEKELHDQLSKGGLKLTLGPEGAGQFIMVWERSGGYWQDNGAGELIGSGRIKVKQGLQPVRYSGNGLIFEDGSELEADVIILSTGYIKMDETNKQIFGSEIVGAIGPVHGLDREGELNGVYRPTAHPGLWFAGGEFYCSRFMSKQLAMLIKAQELGLITRPSQVLCEEHSSSRSDM